MPCISTGGKHVLKLLVSNHSKKKVCFKEKEIAVNSVKLDGETKNLTNIDILKGSCSRKMKGSIGLMRKKTLFIATDLTFIC